MGKYSADSDSNRQGRKSKRSKRSRSSSSSSSSASNSYTKKSYKQNDCCETTQPTSKSQYTTSLKQCSPSHPNKQKINSKDLQAKSSISRSKSKEGIQLKSTKPSRSSSRHWSYSHNTDRSKCRSKSLSPENYLGDSPVSRQHVDRQEFGTEDQLQTKLHKAMKAAQSADNQLRQQGLLLSSSLALKEGVCNVHNSTLPESLDNILDEINDSHFFPKYFISSKALSHISVEQPACDIVPASDASSSKFVSLRYEPSSTFHSQLLVDPELKMNKWIKKLFYLRQKAINGDPLL